MKLHAIHGLFYEYLLNFSAFDSSVDRTTEHSSAFVEENKIWKAV